MPTCSVCGLQITPDIDYVVVSKDGKETIHVFCFNEDVVISKPKPIVKEIVPVQFSKETDTKCPTCGHPNWKAWEALKHKLQEQQTAGLIDD